MKSEIEPTWFQPGNKSKKDLESKNNEWFLFLEKYTKVHAHVPETVTKEQKQQVEILGQRERILRPPSTKRAIRPVAETTTRRAVRPSVCS